MEQDTLEGNWKPVIVADGPVCAEICTLEDEIERAAVRAGRVAEELGYEDSVVVYCSELARVAEEEDVTRFLQELGWLFQRSYFRSLNGGSASTLVVMPLSIDVLRGQWMKQNVACPVMYSIVVQFEGSVW